MREELHVFHNDYINAGITPAHAGRIEQRKHDQQSREDHPRACGKNRNRCPGRHPVGGSPPRMREEFGGSGASTPVPGITPAHAGRIPNCHQFAVMSGDHPRACGKNFGLRFYDRVTPGSPPRMREEYPVLAALYRLRRITPAHAGRIIRV